MKKKVFYLVSALLLTGAVTIFFACNSSVENLTDELNDNLEALDSALDDLNMDTLAVEPVIDDTLANADSDTIIDEQIEETESVE